MVKGFTYSSLRSLLVERSGKSFNLFIARFLKQQTTNNKQQKNKEQRTKNKEQRTKNKQTNKQTKFNILPAFQLQVYGRISEFSSE